MLHWIEHHGFECIVAYIAFAAIVGSMPELPSTATYWQRWGYGFLHLFAANVRSAAKNMNFSLPGDKPELPKENQ